MDIMDIETRGKLCLLHNDQDRHSYFLCCALPLAPSLTQDDDLDILNTHTIAADALSIETEE